MSILTHNEREGLEEVFLSIKTKSGIYEKLKSFLSLWLGLQMRKEPKSMPNSAPSGKIGDKITKKSAFFSKVKKSLSK